MSRTNVAVPGAAKFPLIQEPTYAETAIDGLLLISPKLVEDERGVVREFYRQSEWRSAGLPDLGPWKQLNLTYTRYGAVRAFHAEAMVKLIGVAAGEAFGAYVDLRPSSATAGAVVTTPLQLGTQVLVPRGVGNGFQSVTREGTQYVYCFDEEWRSGMPGVAVTPLDAALGVQWPVPLDPSNAAQVSKKDASAPLLRDVLNGEQVPFFGGTLWWQLPCPWMMQTVAVIVILSLATLLALSVLALGIARTAPDGNDGPARSLRRLDAYRASVGPRFDRVVASGALVLSLLVLGVCWDLMQRQVPLSRGSPPVKRTTVTRREPVGTYDEPSSPAAPPPRQQ